MSYLTEQLNPWAEPRKDYPSRGAAAPEKAPRAHAQMVPLKVNSHRQHLEENWEYSEGTQHTPKGLHVCGSFCLWFLNVKICSYSSLKIKIERKQTERKAALPARLPVQRHKGTAVPVPERQHGGLRFPLLRGGRIKSSCSHLSFQELHC